MLVDGHRSQLKTLLRCLRRSGVGAPTIVLDFIHVSEYVWKAGMALHGEVHPKLEGWVSEHLLSILRGRSGMWRVESVAVRPVGAWRARRAKRWIASANYLLKNAGYLKYDTYLAKGFPIATGVIEGACRYLVKDRMEVTGARWSLAGAEAVLRLEASDKTRRRFSSTCAAGQRRLRRLLALSRAKEAEKPCRALRGGQF